MIIGRSQDQSDQDGSEVDNSSNNVQVSDQQHWVLSAILSAWEDSDYLPHPFHNHEVLERDERDKQNMTIDLERARTIIVSLMSGDQPQDRAWNTFLIDMGYALDKLGLERVKFLLPSFKAFMCKLLSAYQSNYVDIPGISRTHFYRRVEQLDDIRLRFRQREEVQEGELLICSWWFAEIECYLKEFDSRYQEKCHTLMIRLKLGAEHAHNLLIMWSGDVEVALNFFTTSLRMLEQQFGDIYLTDILARSNFDVADAKSLVDEHVSEVVSSCRVEENEAKTALSNSRFDVQMAMNAIRDEKVMILSVSHENISRRDIRSHLERANWEERIANESLTQLGRNRARVVADAQQVPTCSMCTDPIAETGVKRKVSTCQGTCYRRNHACYECAMEVHRRSGRCPYCRGPFRFSEIGVG